MRWLLSSIVKTYHTTKRDSLGNIHDNILILFIQRDRIVSSVMLQNPHPKASPHSYRLGPSLTFSCKQWCMRERSSKYATATTTPMMLLLKLPFRCCIYNASLPNQVETSCSKTIRMYSTTSRARMQNGQGTTIQSSKPINARFTQYL